MRAKLTKKRSDAKNKPQGTNENSSTDGETKVKVEAESKDDTAVPNEGEDDKDMDNEDALTSSISNMAWNQRSNSPPVPALQNCK